MAPGLRRGAVATCRRSFGTVLGVRPPNWAIGPSATWIPWRREPPSPGDEPLPPPAREESGRLVRLGRRGLRARPRGGQADPPLRRLRGLPLVPRHGARVLRGRGDGAAH